MSPEAEKTALIAEIGGVLVQFQDASNRFDDMAAAVLALTREDLACVSLLLFGGPAPMARIGAALRLAPKVLKDTVGRLELAGYARRTVAPEGALRGGEGPSETVELTEHARTWVATLWGPLEAEGAEFLGLQSLADLRLMVRMMRLLLPMQERHAARIAALLDVPTKPATMSNRRRGGLSPAALRRVQLYVEANLARPICASDLAARAALSEFHFARAFKISVGVTPRVYVEKARIARAEKLLRESALPLAEVAEACGLGTQSRFTTTFRGATGLTPATFRRGDR